MTRFLRILSAFLVVHGCSQFSFATLNNVDKTQVFSKNLLSNGGFENGKFLWTASAGTFAVTTSSPMIGGQHATWDAAASADTLTYTAVSIPAGMYGRDGVVSCLFTTASGTATHSIQAYDGSNILVSSTITSSTTPTRTSANFVFPSSGSISLRLYANADEPSVAKDDCYLGPAEGFNIGSISQATFVGGMENAGASTCAYLQSTSSGLADYIDLGAGASCAAWTVVSNGPGTISAQGTNDHRLIYADMPPGQYQFRLAGTFFKGTTTAGTVLFRLSDGTNTYQPQVIHNGSAATLATNSLEFDVTITSAGSRTFKLQCADDAAVNCSWYNGASYNASWKIYRFPTTSQQAYFTDQSDYGPRSAGVLVFNTGTKGNSGAPPIDQVHYWRQGSWLHVMYRYSQTNSTGSASGSGDYRITIPSVTAGCIVDSSIIPFYTGVEGAAASRTSLIGIGARYDGAGAMYQPILYSATEFRNLSVNFSGTPTVGFQGSGGQGALTSATLSFSNEIRVPCSNWVTTNRAPQLVNSTVSAYTGVMSWNSATVSSAGVVSQEYGDWITGNCTNASPMVCTLTGFSAAPNCTGVVAQLGTTSACHVTTTSATSISISCNNDTGTASVQSVSKTLMCHGPR